MSCRLQVFKTDTKQQPGWVYRFAVVDNSKAKSYPANFVCMLPIKVHEGKTNNGSAFGLRYGNKSLDIAIELLKDAFLSETDSDVKSEIERRLKLIEPRQVNAVKCCHCKKLYQPRKVKRYKQNFCDDCLKAATAKRVV